MSVMAFRAPPNGRGISSFFGSGSAPIQSGRSSSIAMALDVSRCDHDAAAIDEDVRAFDTHGAHAADENLGIRQLDEISVCIFDADVALVAVLDARVVQLDLVPVYGVNQAALWVGGRRFVFTVPDKADDVRVVHVAVFKGHQHLVSDLRHDPRATAPTR